MPLVSDIDIKCCLSRLQENFSNLQERVVELENAEPPDIEAAITEYLIGLAGYAEGEIQTLTNNEGTLTWVTEGGGGGGGE